MVRGLGVGILRRTAAICAALVLWCYAGAQRACASFPCSDSAWAMRDSISDARVQSVSLSPTAWSMAPPIVPLNGGTLRLCFDYLGASPGWLRYRFVRCEKDWRRSDAMPMEYLTGFEVNTVSGYTPSTGASPDYTHYELTFPNRDVRFKLSGNYLVQVIDPINDSVVLLQRQFALSEDILQGELSLSGCSDDNFVESTALEVKLKGRSVARTPEQLTVYSKQNWNDPRYQELRYERTAGWEQWTYGSLFTLRRNGVWNNGAEWRVLDLRSLDLPGVGVERIREISVENHVEVTVGEANNRWNPPKADGLKGYYKYGERRGDEEREDAEVTASYAYVYFSLKPSDELSSFSRQGTPLLVVPGIVGAEGGVEMRYSEARGQYEATLYMKQGVYSYRYLWKTSDGIDYLPFEGSYAETQNEYHVLCYLRGDTDRSDRLVAHIVVGDKRSKQGSTPARGGNQGAWRP